MTETNNDFIEVPVVEEATVETVEEVVEETAAPVEEAIVEIVEEPVVEEKPAKKAKAAQPAVADIAPEKVAIFSERNIAWQEAGILKFGYNIVTKEAADKWLTRKGVRLAEPQELANKVNK